MKATFRAMGAAGGVTGSAFVLDLEGHELLVDCGLFQGDARAARRNRVSPIAAPAALHTVILTHGHLDHVGRLPLVIKGGFKGPVLGHPATLAIAAIVLRDAAKIGALDGDALYSAVDVDETIARFRPISYATRHPVAPGVTMTLFDAGHILGSASVLLETSGGSILLSGDLGRRGTPILRDPNTVYPPGTRVDHVVIESTYGDRAHPSGATLAERLRATLARALGDGGKVLIPAFSIGRTQELVYHLRTLYEAGDFAGVPVVVDGPMGLDVTALYERHRDCYDDETRSLARVSAGPLTFRDLYSARGRKSSEQVRAIEGPAIIVAGSGMCTGGRIMGYLEDFLPDPRTDVLLVGYQAEGTLGRRLLEGAARVRVGLGGKEVCVRARVTGLAGFSAHADREELLAWLSNVPGPPRGAFVCHGEADAAASLACVAAERFGMATTVPREGETRTLWG